MKTLHITLLQTTLHWQNPKANQLHFSNLIQSLQRPTDVIILPEMFTTGFTMAAATNAESEPGTSLRWMQQQAEQTEAVITGSLIIQKQEQFYNRLYWVEPSGQFQSYDKKHLFTYADEDRHFTTGNKRLIVDYKGWRICPLICYDLRFPVWSRNDVDYDLLIYIANWPATRSDAWQSLLKARAIENMSYVAGVNRIGTDGNGHNYVGASVVYNALGEQLSSTNNNQSISETISLNHKDLVVQRQKYGFLNDRDKFMLS